MAKMSAFNLALVTLISLGSVCANPAEKAVEKYKKDCLEPKVYKFVLTNAIDGNKCFKPNAKCDSTFEAYVAEYGSTVLKKVACAKPGQSVPYSFTVKYFDEKLAALLLYIQDNQVLVLSKARVAAFLAISQTSAVESIAYGVNTRCGVDYFIDANPLLKDDRTTFPESKGADCGSACWSR